LRDGEKGDAQVKRYDCIGALADHWRYAKRLVVGTRYDFIEQPALALSLDRRALCQLRINSSRIMAIGEVRETRSPRK
jgi:hypothetical protein